MMWLQLAEAVFSWTTECSWANKGGGSHLGKRGKRVSGTWQWSKELMQIDGGGVDPHSLYPFPYSAMLFGIHGSTTWQNMEIMGEKKGGGLSCVGTGYLEFIYINV